MDPFTTNRVAKALEKEILSRAEKEGYEKLVRSFIRKMLGSKDDEMNSTNTEAFVFALGVLHRAGYISENDIAIIMGHLGLLR